MSDETAADVFVAALMTENCPPTLFKLALRNYLGLSVAENNTAIKKMPVKRRKEKYDTRERVRVRD